MFCSRPIPAGLHNVIARRFNLSGTPKGAGPCIVDAATGETRRISCAEITTKIQSYKINRGWRYQDVLQPNKWRELIRRNFSDDAIGQEMNEFAIADDTAAQNIVVLHCRVAGRLCFTAQLELTWSARP